MSIFYRRALLLSPLVLAACGTGTTGPTAAEVIDDLTLAVTTIGRLVPLLAPAAAGKIAPYLATAQTLITRLSTSLPDATNAITAASILDALNGALDVLATTPGLSPQVQQYIAVVAVLLPVVAIFVRKALPAAALTETKVKPAAMTPAQARAVLGSKP